VADAGGRVLASVGAETLGPGTDLAASLPASAAQGLASTLDGRTGAGGVVSRQPGGRLVVMVPIAAGANGGPPPTAIAAAAELLSGEPITVLVVDDHEIVRQGSRAFLDLQPDIAVVGLADSGAEAVRLAAALVPDVALIDMLMPEMDGVETTRQVRCVSPHTQVVILTSYHEDEHVFPALRAGALSNILKDVRPAELAEAVRRAAAGESVLHRGWRPGSSRACARAAPVLEVRSSNSATARRRCCA